MFGFDNLATPEPTKTEVADQLMAHAFRPLITYSGAHQDGQEAREISSQNFKSKSQDASIHSFGSIKHIDLPVGYTQEISASGNIGGGKEKVFRAKDGDSIIVAAILQAPLVMPEAEAKLKAILDGGVGSLTDTQRAEACGFLVKFADNQYKPGNSINDYGDAWKAPSYFVRSMEVKEIDGKRVLFVDGGYTPAPWKPEDGLNQAQTRFCAIFLLGREGAQTVYLEANPQNYSRQENKFVQAIKQAKF